MTISTTHNSVAYTGNGVNATYPYTFLIFDEDDLEVYVDSVLQVRTTDYTVSNILNEQGGNVVFESGSIPIDGASVTIYRNVPQTQETDYVEGDKFSPETHERALDRLTCEVQQLQDEVDRCVKLAKTVYDTGSTDLDYLESARANKYIGFDENGDLVVADDLGTWRNIWTTATAYNVADLVIDGANGADTQNIYRCTTRHTSGTWATDLAVPYWTLVIDVSAVEAAQAAAEAAQAYAEEWANKAEDSLISAAAGGDQVDDYSALHHANKAEAWHDLGFTLDASPDSDHTVSGFRADALTAGENLVFGDFCYMKSDGKCWKADATDDTAVPAAFMCMETVLADADAEFLVRGFARDDSWSWTVGALLYLSTTAGGLTETAPSGTGNIIQPMAIAITATIIMLNPTYGYAEHK